MIKLSFLLSSVAGLALASSFTSPADSASLFQRSQLLSSGCPTTGAASCHNTTVQSNLCCFESPGGLLLQTQFWDTNPSTGPVNSWTIHGLWPDNCDTTFTENCDPSRDYTGISTLLSNNGASDTLAFMQTFWVDINGQNEQFWEHEWATHGTCYSTLKVACLPSGSVVGAEAVAFFQKVVALFQTLPTYTWLANEGITPTTSTTFTLAQLTSALQAQSGVTPALSCSGSILNAISWYFNVKGSVIDGDFVRINTPISGTCPSSGISYPPKSGGVTVTPTSTATSPPSSSTSATSTSATTAPTSTPTSSSTSTTSTSATATGTAAASIPTKATIHAVQASGSTTGGLLSLGTWSTQTLATYTLSGTPQSFTMISSKGNCGVSSGTFACGSGVSQTTFSAVSSGGLTLLGSGGSTAFSSDGLPSGTTVFTVFTGSSHAKDYTLSIVGS